MLPLAPDKRARGRRIAEAVLGVGTRARARRAAAGDGAVVDAAPEAPAPPTPVTAAEAAARIDAARERLRAKIPAPAEDE